METVTESKWSRHILYDNSVNHVLLLPVHIHREKQKVCIGVRQTVEVKMLRTHLKKVSLWLSKRSLGFCLATSQKNRSCAWAKQLPGWVQVTFWCSDIPHVGGGDWCTVLRVMMSTRKLPLPTMSVVPWHQFLHIYPLFNQVFSLRLKSLFFKSALTHNEHQGEHGQQQL